MEEKHCTATLQLSDDYSDNPVTFHCKLQEGHEGPHQEAFTAGRGESVIVTWTDPVEANDDEDEH